MDDHLDLRSALLHPRRHRGCAVGHHQNTPWRDGLTQDGIDGIEQEGEVAPMCGDHDVVVTTHHVMLGAGPRSGALFGKDLRQSDAR